MKCAPAPSPEPALGPPPTGAEVNPGHWKAMVLGSRKVGKGWENDAIFFVATCITGSKGVILIYLCVCVLYINMCVWIEIPFLRPGYNIATAYPKSQSFQRIILRYHLTIHILEIYMFGPKK